MYPYVDYSSIWHPRSMQAYTLGEWRGFKENPDLIRSIAKAINGQYNAVICYEKLSQLAPTEEEKRQIKEIRQDEINHYRKFSQIYIRLTGKQPQTTVISCPDDYKEGLKFALKDEQETVDFYLDIADKARNPVIKNTFTRAAHDEQNHAVWFLYFWTKHNLFKCRCKHT